MVDIVRVMNDVMQVIDGNRRDRELAAIAAQPAPRPRVVRHARIGGGHRARRFDKFGRDDHRVLGAVVVLDGRSVLIPVGKTRLVLAEHEPDAVVEDAVHVANVATVFQRRPHSRPGPHGDIGRTEPAWPLLGVGFDAVCDLSVAHRGPVEAALGARLRDDPRPVLGVGLDHGVSVTATSRIRSPAPDSMGSPCPKHAVCTSSPASRLNDATVRARSWLKTPSITDPTLAMVSPANSTPWSGRYTAMLPSVCPGMARTCAPPPKSSTSPSVSSRSTKTAGAASGSPAETRSKMGISQSSNTAGGISAPARI